MQVLYARGTSGTDFNSEKQLYVNNCGFYKDVDTDICVNRPHGRDDYHLLLCLSGRIGVGAEKLTPGKAYLYYPTVPQHYRYESGEGSEYYWLHFSGKSVPELLEEYGLKDGVLEVGQSRGEVERIIKMMLRALSEEYKNADGFCEGLLSALLALISAPPVISSPYGKAIKILGDPASEESIEEIASIYNMSPNHFSTIFSQEIGQTFIEYLTEVRMEKAKELLRSTSMRTTDVAFAVGYKDPHYFSYSFKKTQGCTPKEFRMKN